MTLSVVMLLMVIVVGVGLGILSWKILTWIDELLYERAIKRRVNNIPREVTYRNVNGAIASATEQTILCEDVLHMVISSYGISDVRQSLQDILATADMDKMLRDEKLKRR